MTYPRAWAFFCGIFISTVLPRIYFSHVSRSRKSRSRKCTGVRGPSRSGPDQEVVKIKAHVLNGYSYHMEWDLEPNSE